MRLLQTLYTQINERPDYEILTVNERPYTYSDIKKNMDRWTLVLQHCGILPRQKIIIYLKETIDFVGLFFALCELDCIIIPIDASANPDIISKAIDSSKGHGVISSQDLGIDGFQKVIPLSYGYTYYRTSYEERDLPDNILQMLYTSGTTGLSKCVLFSKENLANNIFNLAEALALFEEDIIYTPISLMLPAALHTVLLPALLSGARIYVSDSTVPGSVLRTILNQAITVFFAVPFYYKLLSANGLCHEKTWKNVRLCLTSSAYLSEADFQNFYQLSKKALHSIYCSSEAGTIAYNDAADLDSLKRFVGRPLAGCEVSLLDVDGEGLGEIIVKGDMVASKYYLNEDLNNEVFCNGWIKTGDLGILHKNGYLELRGRISETMNIAGHLVNPVEVEQEILNFEAVQDALVYKYRNNADIDMLGAMIVLAEGRICSEMDIINRCKAVLPSHQVPKKIQFAEQIDTGRYGKKRRKL